MTTAARAVHEDPIGGARNGPRSAVDPREDLRDFHLAGWLVQPSLGRLTCDGVTVRLRPQLMDMLLCLAARAGRTVAPEEFFATVWSGRFVAESALPRCVAELRQAFGDDARQPRIIETIPKRGYRLIAPVSRSAAPLLAVGRATGALAGGDSAARDAGSAAALHLTAECAAPRPPRFDRAISLLRVIAMAFGARLWKGRPARSVVPGETGEAETDGAHAR